MLPSTTPARLSSLRSALRRGICLFRKALVFSISSTNKGSSLIIDLGPTLESPPLPELDFVGSIRQTIYFLLELGELNLPSLAEVAGTSSRSLKRRLAASGLGFGRLVDEARFQAASRLLRDPTVRIIDVSAELGYTDSANFTRAFRRWAGVSPLAFRRAAQLGCNLA